ncbi:unnamed protein product [Bursaphelenchus okinawaensis]|uniref:Checkpoint protein n=1 Tax=Bursaphelenchus okinawaensis TaxID=465554 RepID=A0A811JX06_9BILA|nr:unnamed protein product [Bursaphelenchus okinawaensis]CAG9086132.1 unnamed protein product [Bursaphelenchus okinawaensis]
MTDSSEFDSQASTSTVVTLVKHGAGDVPAFLRSVNFGEYFVLIFTSDGIRVVSDDGIDEQGNFYFLADFFDTYVVKGTDVRIRVNSKKFINCHNYFGQKANFDLRWELETVNGQLKVMLRRDNEIGKLSVATYDLVQLQDTKEIESNDAIVHIEFREAGFLREIIKELDNTATMVEFDFRDDRMIIVSKSRVVQKTQVRFSEKNSDKVTMIKVAEGGVKVFYRIDQIRHLLPLLKITTRVSVLINEDGVLTLQGRQDTCASVVYLQFFINRFIPDIDDEDEDEHRAMRREMYAEAIKEEQESGEVLVRPVNQRLALNHTENPLMDPAIRQALDFVVGHRL